MRFFRGGIAFGSATHVDGETIRRRVRHAVVAYKRSRAYTPVFLTHMEPTRSGTLHLPAR